MTRRLLVVGGGAVGSYLAGWLSREGRDVTILDTWPEHVDAVNERGLRVSGPHRTFVARPAMLNLNEAQRLARQEPFDAAFICVKSFDTAWAAPLASRFIARDGYLVSAQNCWNDPALAAAVGVERAVGLVMSSIQVALWEPGNVARGGKQRRRDAGYDVFRAGEHDGRISRRIRELAAMLDPIDGARVTDNLWGERWAKLCQNCMGNPVTAVSAMGVSQLAADPRARELQMRLAAESARVGLAIGYRIPDFAGFSAEVWADAASPQHYEAIDAALSARKDGDNWRPSMAQDAEKRRPTEIDEMNGFVLRKARELAEPVPVTEAVVNAVRAFERGEIEPAPNQIEAILGASGNSLHPQREKFGD